MVATVENLKNRGLKELAREDLVVIHTMEAQELPQTAEGCANYFKRVNADSHWCVDNNSRVRVIPDGYESWTTPGVHHRALNIEQAGYARQNAHEWADKYSLAMLDISALCAAEWCVKYDIPVRKLTIMELKAGKKGFVGHVDATYAYRKSTHTDPGAGFPWSYYLSLVARHVAELKGDKLPGKQPPPRTRPGWIDVDGYWGEQTTTKLQKVLKMPVVDGIVSRQTKAWKSQNPGLTGGWDWSGKKTDNGSPTIEKHQRILKRRGHYTGNIDGKVGPKYFAALQRDLGTTDDGEIWAPSRAVFELQRRLNKGKI